MIWKGNKIDGNGVISPVAVGRKSYYVGKGIYLRIVCDLVIEKKKKPRGIIDSAITSSSSSSRLDQDLASMAD